MSYQDTWINGRAEKPGQRECSRRFEAMRPVLDQYNRRFSVLDIGAAQGYFSFRIAEEYDAVCTMIEGNRQLADLCRRNHLPRTILLNRRVSVGDLERLAECEHFDVVLALNVLHHFGEPERACHAVLAMGSDVVIETPPVEDKGACGQGAIPRIQGALPECGDLLARTPSHVTDVDRSMLCFKRSRLASLSRSYFDVPEGEPFGGVRIVSASQYKRVWFPEKREHRDWVHGINLRTYQMLGGQWPPPGAVADAVLAHGVPRDGHGDIRPWNFIIDGERVHLIDGRDSKAIFDDDDGLLETAADVRRDDPLPPTPKAWPE